MRERPPTSTAATGRRGRGTRAASVSGVAALQRLVGNRGLRLLRQPAPVGAPSGLARPEVGSPDPTAKPGRRDLVFLMGDVKGDDFYTSAEKYYKKQYPKATIVTRARTLTDILKRANALKAPIGSLVIVSHGNAEGTLYFGLGIGSPTMLQYETLRKDLDGRSVLPAADPKVFDADTTVRIKGCNVGRSPRMLDLLDRAFGGDVTVTAPTHAQLFGRSVAAEVLGEYYVSLPGAVRRTDDEVLQMFKDKYPWMAEREWRELLPHLQQHTVLDRIPANPRGLPYAPRSSAHAEAWFRGQATWRELQRQGYTAVLATLRPPRTATDTVQVVVRASGQDLAERKLTYTFAQRPSDDALIAEADASVGLPGVSEYKVEPVAPDSVDLNVVARRTVWVIEGRPIAVGGTAVRGGRTQADWHTSSTYARPAP